MYNLIRNKNKNNKKLEEIQRKNKYYLIYVLATNMSVSVAGWWFSLSNVHLCRDSCIIFLGSTHPKRKKNLCKNGRQAIKV